MASVDLDLARSHAGLRNHSYFTLVALKSLLLRAEWRLLDVDLLQILDVFFIRSAFFPILFRSKLQKGIFSGVCPFSRSDVELKGCCTPLGYSSFGGLSTLYWPEPGMVYLIAFSELLKRCNWQRLLIFDEHLSSRE
jgi:hypothetical protein